MRRINLLLLGFILSFLAGFVFTPRNNALALTERYGDWHMGPGMMGSWGMGGFGMIYMMVFWVLAIVGLIFVVKWLIQATRGNTKKQSENSLEAIEILKQRYARGEIDQAEFESKKRSLAD